MQEVILAIAIQTNIIPKDGGPLYAETDMTHFIAEPWNAISSLAIALPSVYWAFKLKWNIKQFGFIYFLIPLLFSEVWEVHFIMHSEHQNLHLRWMFFLQPL